MLKLTRKQVSTIFAARTRMVKVKGNYKNGYQDLKCRACQHPCETQTHVLNECRTLHPGTSISTENSINVREMPTDEPSTRPRTMTNVITESNLNANLTDDHLTIRTNDTDLRDRNTIEPNDDPDTDTTGHYKINDIFSEDPDTLKEVSKFINDTITELMLCDE